MKLGCRQLSEVPGGLWGEGQPARGGVQARDEDPVHQVEGGRAARRARREASEASAEGGRQARGYVSQSLFSHNTHSAISRGGISPRDAGDDAVRRKWSDSISRMAGFN